MRFATLLALVVPLACGGSGAGSDPGPDGSVGDVGGDPGPFDTGWHPDVPPVLPADACEGATPVIAFQHGFEPGQILPDDPTYLGFAVVDGDACPDGTGTRSLAWMAEGEGAYAALAEVDVPTATDGGPWLSFCLVFEAHPGDQLRVEVIADVGDPETVWSSSPTEEAAAHVVVVSLVPWAGQHARFSLHASKGDEAADPPRDVRVDSLAIWGCGE
jgi:hypothetical protein